MIVSMALVVRRLGRSLRRGSMDPEFQVLGVGTASVLLAGTLFYWLAEEWSLVDSLYFCVCSLTTIGYGDLAPTSDLSKLFTVAYVFVGIGLIAAFIARVATFDSERPDDGGRHRT